ncbi:MAG: SIS domain-containing protein [Nitrosotalea sp.]
MLDDAIIAKYDPTGMHKIYDMWTDIARTSYETNKDVADFKDIDHIVFAGMGGSGTIGDIFSSILSKSSLHTYVVKGYHLPSTVDANTLVVATSISGNTAETLTVLESCSKLDCKIAAFSSGGKMMEYCIKNMILHKKIESLHSPRAALPAFLYTMLSFFESQFNIKHEDVTESIKHLEILQNQICSPNLTPTNPSLGLAEWITGIPLVYYPWGLRAAAIRFRNSFQENVKTHAITADVVEASHNGIVSWERPSNIQPILVRGQDDYIKTKERWEIIKEYFDQNKIEYREILSVKGSILSKLINLIYLLDYASIYTAFLCGVDPAPVSSIDFIKKRTG